MRRSTLSVSPGHEPEWTPPTPHRAGGVPSLSAACEGDDLPPAPDPDAPPWQLPLVRTIPGGRAEAPPKEGRQADGGASDVEATLERQRSGSATDDPPSEDRRSIQEKRLDTILVGLGEAMLATERSG